MSRPPVTSVRPMAMGAITTKGTSRPRKPMMALRPAATSPWRSAGAWSAISSGQAVSTAAPAAPSSTVASSTIEKVGATANKSMAPTPTRLPLAMVMSAPARLARRPQSVKVRAVLP
jgi:hypothetical protein